MAATASYVDAVDWASCHGLRHRHVVPAGDGLTRKEAVVAWRFLGSPTGRLTARATPTWPLAPGGTTRSDWARRRRRARPTGARFQPAKALTRQLVAALWWLVGAPTGDP